MAEHGKCEGQQPGNYRLIRLLGQAGFSEAYLGEHLHLLAQVAVKVLQANVADFVAFSFSNDARAIAHLFHPHIFRFLNFAVKDGTLFLVMEDARNSIRQQVQSVYNAPAAALLPVSEEMMEIGSAGMFSLVYPDHLYSKRVRGIVAQLMIPTEYAEESL